MNFRMHIAAAFKPLNAAPFTDQFQETSLHGSFQSLLSMACLHINSPALSKKSTAPISIHLKQPDARPAPGSDAMNIKSNPIALI